MPFPKGLKEMHQSSKLGFVLDLVYGSYLRAAEQLHGLDASTRDLSFSRDLFKILNIRWDRWPRVTVTGSKGKGSTAVLLASILQASGEQVGLITSPEMYHFNERIRLNGRCVSDEELEMAAHEISSPVLTMRSQITPPHYIGPGGIILALAATIFAKSAVSVLVVEAGRGGEYDEARLIEAQVSVLTPIMLEHPEKLGATVQEIARTKTAITAKGRPIVTAPQSDEVLSVIRDVAEKLHSSVHSAIFIEHSAYTPDGVICDIRVGATSYKNLQVSLAGLYQAENAATAILAAQTLTSYGIKCTADGISNGVRRVRWPGRAQIVRQQPWILVDCTMHREAAQHICELVRSSPAKRIHALVGVPKPKDLDGVCYEIAKVAERIVLTEVSSSTITWYDNAVSIASQYHSNVEFIPSATEALVAVMSQVQPDEGILVLGTPALVGSALHFWQVDTCSIW
jgi:dihydrofolate synthase/folylpolyglutamate synthase